MREEVRGGFCSGRQIIIKNMLNRFIFPKNFDVLCDFNRDGSMKMAMPTFFDDGLEEMSDRGELLTKCTRKS